jgi:ABC-2 type transport system permease protein
MTSPVLAKTLADQRRGLRWWSAGLTALVGSMAALWPSVRSMADLTEMLDSYPKGLQDLFDMKAITTGGGYLNAELFSIMLPAMFVVFAIGRGARLLAGEEQDRTLELLLVTPRPRSSVLVSKAAGLVLATAALGVVLFAVTAAASLGLAMGIGLGQLAAAALSMTLLGIEHGLIAIGVGAATGRRSVAVSVAGTVAVAGYVLFVLARLVGAVRPWGVLSPFEQALASGPIGGGLPAVWLWMPLVGLVALGAAIPVFERRDITV